jgi:hypothetical protein
MAACSWMLGHDTLTSPDEPELSSRQSFLYKSIGNPKKAKLGSPQRITHGFGVPRQTAPRSADADDTDLAEKLASINGAQPLARPSRPLDVQRRPQCVKIKVALWVRAIAPAEREEVQTVRRV